MSPPTVTRPRPCSAGDHRHAADPAVHHALRASKIVSTPSATAMPPCPAHPTLSWSSARRSQIPIAHGRGIAEPLSARGFLPWRFSDACRPSLRRRPCRAAGVREPFTDPASAFARTKRVIGSPSRRRRASPGATVERSITVSYRLAANSTKRVPLRRGITQLFMRQSRRRRTLGKLCRTPIAGESLVNISMAGFFRFCGTSLTTHSIGPASGIGAEAAAAGHALRVLTLARVPERNSARRNSLSSSIWVTERRR
jgi:hypothetical protein